MREICPCLLYSVSSEGHRSTRLKHSGNFECGMLSKVNASPRFCRGYHQITGGDLDERDCIIAGVRFTVYYIGSTEVAGMSGTGSRNTAQPVAQVFNLQRKNAKRPQTLRELIVTVCSKNLTVSDEACGKLVASFPISKITFCNIDNFYEKAFVFVARDKPENPFKAFVFTCESKTKAKEAFKALSLAFIINYEYYQASLARGALYGNIVDGGSSPDSIESDNTFFDGLLGAGYEMKPTNGRFQKCEQLQYNSVIPLREESFSPIVNDFYPSQERLIQALPRTRPIQNKTLLHAPDCNSRVRSVSDPTHLGGINPSPAATTLIPRAVWSNNNVDAEVEDAEFTEFAKLRMRSSTLNVASSHPIYYG